MSMSLRDEARTSSSSSSDQALGRSVSPPSNGDQSSRPRKVILTVHSDDASKRISFFPESCYTTPESLRSLLIDAFGLHPNSHVVLVDEGDGALVPLDKSLCYLKEVRLIVEYPQQQSLGEGDAIKHEAFRQARLLHASSTIAAEALPSKAVQTIVEQVRDVLEADQATLYVLDAGSRSLIMVAQANIGDAIQKKSTTGADSEFGSSANFDDATVDDNTEEFALNAKGRIPLMRETEGNDFVRFTAADVAISGEMIVSGAQACLPIRQATGPVIGVLEVSKSNPVNDQDLRALEYITSYSTNVLLRLQLWHQSNRAEKRAEALLKVTKTLAKAKKPRDIVKLVVKEAYGLLHAERVAVFLVHAQEKELEICLSKDATGKRIPMTHGFAGFVARTGEIINIPDARQDPRFDSATDAETGFWTKSVLCCPILDSSGRVIGVIQALNKLLGGKPESPLASPSGGSEDSTTINQSRATVIPFTEEDQQLLEMLTQGAGVSLQNAQLLQAAERAKETTRTLLRLVQLIVGERDFVNLDQLLRASCKQLLDCERCLVAWISRTDNTLRILLDDHQTLSIPMDDDVSIEAKLCAGKGLTNYSFSENGSKLASRYGERTGYRVESILCAPIAGGIDGPVAFILGLNKLEPESSLAHASGQSARSHKHRVSRAYKSFLKEDEHDLLLFCTEVEGALRVKRNVQIDVNNLLLEEAFSGETAESSKSDSSASQTIDSQQKRLMMLYSGFEGSQKQQIAEAVLGNKEASAKRGGVKRTADDRAEEENGDFGSLLGSPTSESKVEQEAKSTVELVLSDSLNLDVLNQQLDVCKSWSLAILLSEMQHLKQCQVDVRKLSRFVGEVQDNYNHNPFHNFYHAFSVLHAAHDLVRRTVEGRKLDALCAISVLLASFCHDLGHMGVTNSFETNTLSELALHYSDDSVLEHYHCHVAFRILYQDPRCNILATMNRDELNVMRRYIIEGILATDMRKHAEHVAELETIVLERRRALLNRSTSFLLEADYTRTPTLRSRRGSVESVGSTGSGSMLSPAPHHPGSPKGSHHRRSSSFFSAVPETEYARRQSPPSPGLSNQNQSSDTFDNFLSKTEGKSFLVRTIVHAADLSGQTLRADLAEDWGRRITLEFTAQAEKERTMGLPVSVPVCSSETDFYKSQVFFIRQIVLPLWRGVAELLPEASPRVDALVRNVEHYEGEVKKLASGATGVQKGATSGVQNGDSTTVQSGTRPIPRVSSLVEVNIALGNPNIDI